MSALAAGALLDLWEAGRARHPLDRSALLASAAAGGPGSVAVADLPLGVVNRRLLEYRERLFGARIATTTRCEHCDELIAIDLRTADLLCADPARDADDTPRAGGVEVEGRVFRLPTLRDLAALASAGHVDEPGLALLERCCVDGDLGGLDTPARERLMEAAGDALEALDPVADLELALRCGVCGGTSSVTLDVGRYVWAEIETRARALLREIDAIARAYGWSESEILALGDARRRTYLELATA